MERVFELRVCMGACGKADAVLVQRARGQKCGGPKPASAEEGPKPSARCTKRTLAPPPTHLLTQPFMLKHMPPAPRLPFIHLRAPWAAPPLPVPPARRGAFSLPPRRAGWTQRRHLHLEPPAGGHDFDQLRHNVPPAAGPRPRSGGLQHLHRRLQPGHNRVRVVGYGPVQRICARERVSQRHVDAAGAAGHYPDESAVGARDSGNPDPEPDHRRWHGGSGWRRRQQQQQRQQRAGGRQGGVAEPGRGSAGRGSGGGGVEQGVLRRQRWGMTAAEAERRCTRRSWVRCAGMEQWPARGAAVSGRNRAVSSRDVHPGRTTPYTGIDTKGFDEAQERVRTRLTGRAAAFETWELGRASHPRKAPRCWERRRQVPRVGFDKRDRRRGDSEPFGDHCRASAGGSTRGVARAGDVRHVSCGSGSVACLGTCRTHRGSRWCCAARKSLPSCPRTRECAGQAPGRPRPPHATQRNANQPHPSLPACRSQELVGLHAHGWLCSRV
jgi:hypothetical protein